MLPVLLTACTALLPGAPLASTQMQRLAPAIRPILARAVPGAAPLGAAYALIPHAAMAAEIEGVPDDKYIVGFALFLLVCIGALQLSLGDIQAQEAQLPSSVNLINKNRKRNSSFIKGKK